MTTKEPTQFNKSNIIYNNVGCDSNRLIGNYKTVVKMVEGMGLTLVIPSKNSPVSQKVINGIEKSKDNTPRYKKNSFKPFTQIVKLSKGTSLSNYMIITINIPLLFDHAEHHKKAKDTFCLITFGGLHQPTKKIESEATKIMSKFLKRKTFKVLPFDVAIDRDDKEPINYKQKESFKAKLMPYSKKGVRCPSINATTLYINKPTHSLHVTRIADYDKYLKQTKHHNQGGISKDLKYWKRLEITIKPPLPTSKENKGFIEYINSIGFLDALYDFEEVVKLSGIKNYKYDYLIYQLNSFVDNRTMNNKKSKEQFNSIEALERSKESEVIRKCIINLKNHKP